MPHTSISRWALSYIAILTLAAGWIRWVTLDDSLWIDELHTSWTVADSLADVDIRASIGNNHPLFFWCTWLGIHVWGHHEIGLRLLPWLAGTILVPSSFWMIRSRTGSVPAAAVAALGLAFDRELIYFAGEARPYAVVQLLTLVHVFLGTNLLRNPSSQIRIAWILTGPILVYLHFTSAVVLASEVAILWWPWDGKPRYRWRTNRTVDFLAMATLCVPAVVRLNPVYQRRSNWQGFAGFQFEWQSLRYVVNVLPGASVLLLILGSAMLLAVIKFVRFKTQAGNRNEVSQEAAIRPDVFVWTLLWFAFLVTSLLFNAAISAWAAPIFFIRYFSYLLPVPYIVAAGCLSMVRPQKWQPYACAVVALATLLAASRGQPISLFQTDRIHAAEDWQSLSQTLRNSKRVVILSSGLIESADYANRPEPIFHEYLELPLRGLYRIPNPDLLHVMTPTKIYGELQLPSGPPAWVVVRGSREKTSKQIQHWQTDESHQFQFVRSYRRNLQLYQVRLEHPDSNR